MPMPFLESFYGVILRGNARLGGLIHFSHSDFKDLTNVHDGGFFFLCSSANLLHLEETSSWVTLMGPWESNGQLLTHLIPCKSEPGHLA